MYSRYKSSLKYVFKKYFSQCMDYLLKCVFWWVYISKLDEVWFIIFPQSTDQSMHVRELTKSWRHFSKMIKQNNFQSLHKNDNNAFLSSQTVKPFMGILGRVGSCFSWEIIRSILNAVLVHLINFKSKNQKYQPASR